MNNEELQLENSRLERKIYHLERVVRASKNRELRLVQDNFEMILLVRDYLSFLELFEDDVTIQRKEQVENQLKWIEFHASRSKAKAQPPDSEEEGEEQLLPGNYLEDF